MKLTSFLKSKITLLDPNPAYPQLSYKGMQSRQNFLGGLCGLALILVGMTIIILKSITVLNKQRLTLSSFIQRDQRQLEMKPQDVILIVNWEYEPNKFKTISFDDYAKVGIDVVLVETFVDIQTGDSGVKVYQFDKCLGNNDTICAVGLDQYRPVCNLQNIDPKLCPRIVEYDILIVDCEPTDPQCSQNLTPGLVPVLMLKDHKFNVLSKNTKNIFQATISLVNQALWMIDIQQDRRIFIPVPVTKLIIQSQQSLWPSSLDYLSQMNRTQTFFYRKQDFIPTLRYKFDFAYMDFGIARSPYTETYYRSFYRFDTMLGEVFGLLGWFSLLISCACAGYNRKAVNNYVSGHLKKQEVEDADDNQQKKDYNYCAFLKDELSCCSKKTGQPEQKQQISIDLIQLSQNVNKIMQILGKQKFLSHIQHIHQNNQPEQLRVSARKSVQVISLQQKLNPVIYTNSAENISENSEEIKRSLLQSQSSDAKTDNKLAN